MTTEQLKRYLDACNVATIAVELTQKGYRLSYIHTQLRKMYEKPVSATTGEQEKTE